MLAETKKAVTFLAVWILFVAGPVFADQPAVHLLTDDSNLLLAAQSTPPETPKNLRVVRINECDNWEASHPEWIFCDAFEKDAPLVTRGRYFEYDGANGRFLRMDGAGIYGSQGMRAKWQQGDVNAGSLKLSFGRNPNSSMDKGIRSSEDFREIYYRIYLKHQSGWEGNPRKLSRATIFVSDNNWSQAMIAHIWEGSADTLGMDPVRCVDDNDQVKCTQYNDFAHMDWIGHKNGVTPVFSPAYSDKWLCAETHVKLNDAGKSNGIFEFWVDGRLEARSDTLNFVRSYTDHALNAVFFENYWNSGSPKDQERYFDNIVVSTQRIGCLP